MATIDISMIVKFTSDAMEGLRNLAGGLTTVGEKAEKVEGNLRAINIVMASIAVNKVIEWGNSFLKTAENIDSMRSRLILATGSIHETDHFIEEMEARFSGSRVEVNGVVDAFARLQQAGVAGAPELAKAIGDVATLSKDANGAVDTVTNAIIRMSVRGTADMRAFISAFREVPQMLSLVATVAGDSLGKAAYTEAQFVADIQSKVFTSAQVIQFFLKAVAANQGVFTTVISAQKTSITGAFKTMEQAWDSFVRELNKTNVATNVVKTVELIKEQMDLFVKTIAGSPEVIDRLFVVIQSLGSALVKLVQGLIPAHGWIILIAEAMAKALASLPPEILAAGFISVFFIGKLGAAAFLGIAALVKHSIEDSESAMTRIVNYILEVLPIGMIGLFFGGKIGVAAALGIGIAFDALLTTTIDIAVKLGLVTGKAADDYVKLRENGGTALMQINKAITDTISGLDTTGKKVKEVSGEFSRDASMFGVTPGLLAAKEEVDLFIQDVKAKFPEIKVVAGDAMNTITQNASILKKEGGSAFDDMYHKAKQLEQGLMDARRMQQAFNDTTLEGAARAIKAYEAEKGNVQDTSQATNKWKQELTGVTDSLQVIVDNGKKIAAEIAGNPLGVQQEQLATANDRVNKQLDDQLAKIRKMKDEYGGQADKIAALEKMEEAINNTKQTGLVQLQQQKAITENIFTIQTQQLINAEKLHQLRADTAALDLKINFNNDPTANLIAGTSAGQIMNQVLQQQLQLKQNLIQYDNQILAAEQERIRLASVGAVTTEIDKTIQKYQELKVATQGAIDALSASAVATNQFWKQVGSTLENSVANALTGLITRSQTLAQVGTQLFQALTAAAVKYLLQLLLIKAIMPALSGFGIPIPKAGDGAVVGGSVIPQFASGGILGGPTLFGIGGEAGPEGILPLSNVGGKLGVNASGMGGSVHVHIHAIDTQSGTEFLMKNMPSIVAGLAARDRINRGKRTAQ